MGIFITKNLTIEPDILVELDSYNTIEDSISKGRWRDFINEGSVLDRRFNPNLQDKYGDHEGDLKSPSCHTALMYACVNELSDVALKLIETDKCDYNLQDEDGDHEGDLKSPSCHTSLMHVCNNKLPDVIKALENKM